MSVYPDSSFLVSLYIPGIHSPQAIGRMASKPCPWITPLHRAEFAHAVERQVFQKVLSRRVALEVHAQFEKDCAEGVWAAVALPEHALDLCVQLARRHAARLRSRTLDALHVASALELKAERFWTFDERQARLARAAGLRLK